MRFAIVMPLANEASTLEKLMEELRRALFPHPEARVFLVIDRASQDDTLAIAQTLAGKNPQLRVLWAPQNRNVVNAYQRGHQEAFNAGFEYCIEMDGGFAHRPSEIVFFLEELKKGVSVVYGARTIAGGSFGKTPWRRQALSRLGTFLSNWVLGTHFKDGTSGFIGMTHSAQGRFVHRKFLSSGHFYQTELRWYLRGLSNKEIPIHYETQSKVPLRSLANSLWMLLRLGLNRKV